MQKYVYGLIFRFRHSSPLDIVVSGTRVMVRISGHFSDDDRDDCGVDSGYKLYFLFLCYLVETLVLFIYRFIVVYSIVTRIEKNPIIADGSPLSVDAHASSNPTSNKKQIAKKVDIFVKRRILRSFS